jgi:hypothetical protein
MGEARKDALRLDFGFLDGVACRSTDCEGKWQIPAEGN